MSANADPSITHGTFHFGKAVAFEFLDALQSRLQGAIASESRESSLFLGATYTCVYISILSRTFPPRSSHMGTPSTLPLISHRATSILYGTQTQSRTDLKPSPAHSRHEDLRQLAEAGTQGLQALRGRTCDGRGTDRS